MPHISASISFWLRKQPEVLFDIHDIVTIINFYSDSSYFLLYAHPILQTKASTVSGLNELRQGFITFFPMLKADSEATEETGMVRRSRAMLASSG